MQHFARLAWLGLLFGPVSAAEAQGPLPPVQPSGLSATIVDFVQVPASSPRKPRARINLLTHAGDGSGRLFVNDMRGSLWVIQDGALRPEPFLDMTTALGGAFDDLGSQVGLSTFTFHPDFANVGSEGFGRVYTSYSEVLPDPGDASRVPDFASPLATATHHSVLAEWSVDPLDPNRIDPGSRRELLRVEEPSRDHNIGQVAFDPNAAPTDADYGLLYAAFGDGGYSAAQGVDPGRTAQDRSNPFGSILRIDPLGGGTDEPYGIPSDNPFVGNTDGHLEEIWAYGFRNPHRFSWDTGGDGSGNGRMLISDIGQDNIEEVDLGTKGANYGWSEREGTFVFQHDDAEILLPLPEGDELLGFTYPVAQYDHDEGAAIVGGFVYRGSLLPHLEGKYVFGDVRNGRIFTVDVDALVDGTQSLVEELTLRSGGQETTLLELLGGDVRADLRFGIDADGELYVLTKRDGMIRRLIPEPDTALLVLTGLAALGAAGRQAPRTRRAAGAQGTRRARDPAAFQVQPPRCP